MWTLAYYYHKPGSTATLTDTLDVGNTKSEKSHAYTINTLTWSGSHTYTYEGCEDTKKITDNGRAFKGYSQFKMKINPKNNGAILRRTFDQTVANQAANVYIDGALVGTWYKSGDNKHQSWRDDDFMIPAKYTNGRTSITIKVKFVSSAADWNEFKYQIFTTTEASAKAVK